MFFQKNDPVHKTMRRLVKRLDKAGIAYAVVGGMAVNATFTSAPRRISTCCSPLRAGRVPPPLRPPELRGVPGRPRRFTDRTSGVNIDFLVTGLFPGSGHPGPIAYPDPSAVSEVIENAHVVDLTTLIQLKLAARRYRDFGDVVELIRFNNLDETFADRLHATVRGDYIECLEEKRREDEYEARQ